MPIPNDRGPAIDAVLNLDLGIESREAAEIVVDRVAGILRYAPMGDNHHNAAACPHCRPQMQAVRDSRLTKVQCRFLLALQAEEYRREGRAETGDEAGRLFTAANVVDAVTIIVFGESASLDAAFKDDQPSTGGDGE